MNEIREIREIPGYYYDQEKRKYFKIQQPSSSLGAYSSHDVKRRKISDEIKKADATALKLQIGRVKRAKILQVPSVAGLLMRESGQTAVDGAQIFAAGLVRQGELERPLLNNASTFAVVPMLRRDGMNAEVWYANSEGLNFLYTKVGPHCRTEIISHTHAYRTLNNGSAGPVHRALQNLGNGAPTSMTLNSTHEQLAVTWLSDGLGDHSRVRICHLTSMCPGLAKLPLPLNYTREQPTMDGGLLTTINEGDIRCSAAPPPGSNLRFALGTSRGIAMIPVNSNTIFPHNRPPRTNRQDVDILALDFQDVNTILYGNRKGILQITDLRDPSLATTKIYHPSSIIHIRSLDEHRVLVAGLQSSLQQYDIRFLKEDTYVLPTRINRSSSARSRNHKPPITYRTRHVLTYPAYHNPSTPNLGLDISSTTGSEAIIAAAQEYAFHLPTVQLFSLHGGHAVSCKALDKEFGPAKLRTKMARESDSWPIRCVRFVEDADVAWGRNSWDEDKKGKGNPMRSLWVGGVDGIRRFAWGVDEEEEMQEEILL